jgi:hypothetical protein
MTDLRHVLENDRVPYASFDKVKTVLTYCVRGERFGEGHWGAMIENGHLRRLLERLAELGSTCNERPRGSEA